MPGSAISAEFAYFTTFTAKLRSVKISFLPLIPLLTAILLLASCKEGNKYRNMREGEIYYNIKYVSNPSTISSDLLPKELVIAFRNDLISTRLKTPIGNSGVITVVNPRDNIYDTYLNILSFKYYFEGNYRDMQPGFNSMEGITVHNTGRCHMRL